MTWYDELYVGESIVHKTKRVKWKITTMRDRSAFM